MAVGGCSMKRWILAFLVMLAASPGWAAPRVIGPAKSYGDYTTSLVFSANDATDSSAIGVSGFCSVRATLQGSDALSLYAVTSSTATASSGTLLKAFTASTSPSNPLFTFTASTQYVKAVATSSSTGGSIMQIDCSPLVGTIGTDAAGLEGAYMTPTTLGYLANLKEFEGLDPTIPWTRYWIDPYGGSDSNPGTYDYPFKTLSKWKELAAFGTWFTIKNGGRDRPMYISQQTFPFPTTESCVVGETVTYDAGASTSRILDIDVAKAVIVFETLTGSRATAADVITTGSQSGASCSWTLGTRVPSIWDGTLALCSLDNTDSCSIANRYTGTGCTTGTCYSAIESQISLATTPVRYDGRIVSIIDAEDPINRPVIHSDKVSLGELDNTALGSNSDRNGLFIAGGSSSYGCLGVANIKVDAVIDDVISSHQEGCVKTLNVYADRVWNVANGSNNNVVTTHGGTSGRGGVISVNGGGVGYIYTDTQGSPVAPTSTGDSAAFMILINGDYLVDATNQSGTNGLAPMKATGGRMSFLDVDGYCRNLPGGTAGCQGWTVSASDGDSTFDFIRSMARTTNTSAGAAISLTGVSSNTIAAKIYRSSFHSNGTPSRGIFTNGSSGSISIDVKGTIFDNLDFYVYDFSSPATTLTGSISGVYDEDTTNIFHFANPGADYTTAASADAASGVAVLSDAYSIQTDATEYTTDFGGRCASTGECFDAYSETFSADFPEVIYDYLPIGIRGYLESGSRSYGAR